MKINERELKKQIKENKRKYIKMNSEIRMK